jgi:hypothetical protein
MGNKAEQAAKEIYKDGIQLVGRRDKNNNLVIYPETMVGILRSAAERGYEQAEKDLAFTWQDIKTIVEIADNIANQGIEKWVGYQDEYYKAILEEFNKTRK